jgi:hypothetical protein
MQRKKVKEYTTVYQPWIQPSGLHLEVFRRRLKVTAIMDKYILQKTLPGCGFVRTKAVVEETFNGWFLMNTPQVSTGGVYSRYMKYSNKNQSGCNKIAVHFFSLHKGHPLCEFEFDRIPSK